MSRLPKLGPELGRSLETHDLDRKLTAGFKSTAGRAAAKAPDARGASRSRDGSKPDADDKVRRSHAIA